LYDIFNRNNKVQLLPEPFSLTLETLRSLKNDLIQRMVIVTLGWSLF